MNKELTLRTYEPRDIPRVIDLICKAIPLLPNYKMITPARERIKYVLEHNIDNGVSFGGWVVCDTQGMVYGFSGGWCVGSLMSYDLVADDIFLWIEPQYRSYRNVAKLINAYVAWAKERGAKLIRASHSAGSFPKGSKEAALFHALLERLGFVEVGSIYHWHSYGET